MSHLSPSLRKAAVLIAALDEPAAEALLAQMGPEQAAKVRSALMVLDDIPAAEQQRVLAEFFQHQGGGRARADDDVSLELDPAVEAAAGMAPLRSAVRWPAEPAAVAAPSFAFLEHVDAQALARVLCGEHPQTVAVVVVQLSPARAAAVLERLPADLATEALERIAWLDELSAEIKADLARALRERLAPHIRDKATGTTSLAHLTAVLGAMDEQRRQRLTDQLVSRNAELKDHLRSAATLSPTHFNDPTQPPRYRLDSTTAHSRVAKPHAAAARDSDEQPGWLEFAELALLDDASLRRVFAEVDPEVALLALTGAEQRLVARLVRKLPSAQAAALRQRLEHPGPVRLREIEQARTAVAAVASRLAQAGEISVPANLRFVAAV